jgi:hypothetical protein
MGVGIKLMAKRGEANRANLGPVEESDSPLVCLV